MLFSFLSPFLLCFSSACVAVSFSNIYCVDIYHVVVYCMIRCSLVGEFRRFGGTYFLHFTILKVVAVFISETLHIVSCMYPHRSETSCDFQVNYFCYTSMLGAAIAQSV
jgi:hypothetical protein